MVSSVEGRTGYCARGVALGSTVRDERGASVGLRHATERRITDVHIEWATITRRERRRRSLEVTCRTVKRGLADVQCVGEQALIGGKFTPCNQ